MTNLQKILIFIRWVAHLLLFSFERQIWVWFLFIEWLFYFIFIHSIKDLHKKYRFIQKAITRIIWLCLAIIVSFILYNRVTTAINNYKEAQEQKKIEERIAKQNAPVDFKLDKLQLSYPKKLSIEKWTYSTFNFFDSSNIFVNKTTRNDLFSWCIAWRVNMMNISYPADRWPYTSWEIEDMANKTWNQYNDLYESVKDWRTLSNENTRMLDHISCLNTEWVISTKYIDIWWHNSLLSYYYITQDDSLWCLSQYVTNLLIPINKNEVYSITFQNNFGDSLLFLKQYANWYWEACLYDKGWANMAKSYSDELLEYYTNGTPIYTNNLKSFVDNDIIFSNIIKSIKIQ